MKLEDLPCAKCRRPLAFGCACLIASVAVCVAISDMPMMIPVPDPPHIEAAISTSMVQSGEIKIASNGSTATKFASAELKGESALIADAFIIHPPSATNLST